MPGELLNSEVFPSYSSALCPTVYRGTQPVLHELSLVVAPRCSTVILGPNGSGKSTLMKVFLRLLYPVVGPDRYVLLMGQETWNVWDLRTQLGIVSADMQQAYPGRTSGLEIVLSGFFSSLDVYDHQAISFIQRTRSDEMMNKLGIAHLRDRPFDEMSTGEQRRTLLGRALVQNPIPLCSMSQPRDWMCRHVFNTWRSFEILYAREAQ